MGEEAEDVLTSTGISDEVRKWYDALKSEFDGFFKALIFERARFNQKNQIGRTVHHCTIPPRRNSRVYGDLRDEMCDRLIVGIRDSATSQKLQMGPGLTLEKGMKTVRQNAAVREQQCQLKQL